MSDPTSAESAVLRVEVSSELIKISGFDRRFKFIKSDLGFAVQSLLSSTYNLRAVCVPEMRGREL